MSDPPFDVGGGAIVRDFSIKDIDALWSAVEDERDRLGRWMPWIEVTRSIDDERAWLERVIADESGPERALGIWVEGTFAGGIGLTIEPFRITAEIGYWIRSGFEGRGIATRASEALIDHAFDDIGVHRMVIRAGVENTRSRAIPERLGFTFEGVHREEGRGTEGFYDLAIYGLLEHEWRAR